MVTSGAMADEWPVRHTRQAKPLSQQHHEAEMARLYDQDEYLRQRMKDDRHVLRQLDRMQRHDSYGRFGRLPASSFSYGGRRTPMMGSTSLGILGDPGMLGVGLPRRRMSMIDGLAGRRALDASIYIREAQLNQQSRALINQEIRLSQERELLRVWLAICHLLSHILTFA